MRKIILRALLGFPIGIAIGQCLSLLSSLGGDTFEPCVPVLIETVGSELGAVALQTLLCGVIGAVSAAGSAIYETDWGIAKQTGLHFALLAIALLPIAYVLGWMKHTAGGVLVYIAVFVVLYILTWIVMYLIWKRRIQALNKKMKTLV